MSFVSELFLGSSIAHTVFVLALVSALGLLLGSIRIGKVQLGVAGILFSGIVVGHFGISIDHHLLEFVREFGLILFVYMVGLQIGPGFLTSFKANGLKLNLLAVSIVLAGSCVAYLLHVFGGLDAAVAVGILTGATTNTPSLGAAQATIAGVGIVNPETLAMPGVGYAIAYPFGIVGILLTMTIIRIFSGSNPSAASEQFSKEQAKDQTHLDAENILVTNKNLDNILVRNIPAISKLGVIVSRVLHEGTLSFVDTDSKVFVGDTLYAVGTKDELEQFRAIIGEVSNEDLLSIPGNLDF